MEALTSCWKTVSPKKLAGTDWTLTGWSWAALKSSFYIPELGLLLDAGLPMSVVPEVIFVTHAHADHIYNLPMLLVDLGHVRPEVFVPAAVQEKVFEFIDASYQMSTLNPKPKVHGKYLLHGVRSGDIIEMTIKKKLFRVEAFHSYHTVPCLSYGFTEVRRRLKPEYKGLGRKEIVALKKSGVEITESVEIPHFAYLGDTSTNIFNPEKKNRTDESGELVIFKYRTLIVECTFLRPDEEAQAKKTRHVYWPELEKVVAAHPEIEFILYHFSRRYKPEEIRTFFVDYPYPNLHIWV